jgi:hypothetical protein
MKYRKEIVGPQDVLKVNQLKGFEKAKSRAVQDEQLNFGLLILNYNFGLLKIFDNQCLERFHQDWENELNLSLLLKWRYDRMFEKVQKLFFWGIRWFLLI